MTPLIKIDNFYLKREDLNITGSAKDRAIELQVQNLVKKGFTKAVISSTGNAAISALHFCKLNNINLTIFISPKISSQKLQLIQNQNSEIIFTEKPISEAFKFAKNNNAYLLRQSTDPFALEGYKVIGEEIIKELPQITSIFIPVGSGTTLLGTSQALSSTVKIFAIQPASNCHIANIFDSNYQLETTSLTDGLTVKFLPLKQKIINAIKSSNGGGFVIQNQDIIDSQNILEKNNIQTSNESALALAGYFKAVKNNIDVGNFPVILLTGSKR